MKKKGKIVIGVIAAVVVVGGGIGIVSGMSGADGSAAMANGYAVIPAEKNDLSKKLSSGGKVIGNGTVDVMTKLSGVEISEVKVSLGDHVKKGDVLCVFDSEGIQEQYDDLKSQIDTSDKKTESDKKKNQRDLKSAKAKKATAVARAQRELDKAVAACDKAYKDYNALVDEYNSHLNDPPAEEGMGYDFDTVYAQIQEMSAGLTAYDDAVTAAQDTYNDTVSQYDEQIQAVQDQIDAEEFAEESDSQKQLDDLSEQLKQCTITAPQDGIITALNVTEGTIPSDAALMTIVNTEKTVLELTVSETDITKISEGMSAVVTSKVLPDEELSAKITRIVNVMSSGEASMEEGAASGGYKVEVTLDEPNDTLLIGMSATVEVTLEEVGEKLSVPYSGIVEKDDDKVVYVAVPDKNESDAYLVKEIEVTVGAQSDFYTEIKDGKIKEGDLIIENPQGDDMHDAVKDGSRITINE